MSADPHGLAPPRAVEHIDDASIDATLDRQLRALLSLSFTRPACAVFRERRYFNDPPRWRWLIRDASGHPVAHLAAHRKPMLVSGRTTPVPIAGIAEVCVHPAHRGHGHVRALLRRAHRWLADEGFAYCVLSGDPRFYTSSGYRPVNNLCWDNQDPSGRIPRVPCPSALVATLGFVAWPAAPVYIPTLPF